MKSKFSILHIIPRYKIGGGPISVLRFIKNSPPQFDNYLIGNNEDEVFFSKFDSLAKGAYDINTCNFSLNSILKVLRIANKVKPQVVHANGKGAAFFGLLIKLLKYHSVSLVYTFHGFHLKFSGFKLLIYRAFEKVVSFFMDVGIAVSESERSFYLDVIGCQPNKVVTIPNGIEIFKRELPNYIKEQQRKYKINIVTLSRIDHSKDLLTMLKAFERLGRGDVGLHIMGGYIENSFEREFKLELDNFYENMKLKDNVYFWGDVEDASGLIHNFDIYWSTSIFEGLPTAVIEAMMSGTLVVGTNCRGNIDLIEHGETGYLSKMRDVESNYSMIKKAISELGQEEGIRIINTAKQMAKRFSVENNVNALTNLYLNLVSKK